MYPYCNETHTVDALSNFLNASASTLALDVKTLRNNSLLNTITQPHKDPPNKPKVQNTFEPKV